MKFPIDPRQKPWAALMWMDRSEQRFSLCQGARAGACDFSTLCIGTCHFRFKPRREGDLRFSGRLGYLASGAHPWVDGICHTYLDSGCGWCVGDRGGGEGPR